MSFQKQDGDEKEYNPNLYSDRKELATQIKELLISCGFRLEGYKGKEKEEVWVIDIAGRPHERCVYVWTSIVNDVVRGLGTDMIRVCVMRDNGKNGLIGSKTMKTRVKRTGKFGAIRKRLYEAMRKAYQAGLDAKTW